MKENKTVQLNLRITEAQALFLDQLIESGMARTRSGIIHYLINQKMIFKK